jgi:hypothetical protein
MATVMARALDALVMTTTLAVLATACSGGGDRSDDSAGASPAPAEGEVREDPAPLTRRFPAVGDPVSVRWMSGVLGEGDSGSDARIDVPGPSTYWIEAVIELAPDSAERLRSWALASSAPSDEGPPPLHELLRSSLPDGPFLAGDALDAGLTDDEWSTDAYLSEDGHTLVLLSLDG